MYSSIFRCQFGSQDTTSRMAVSSYKALDFHIYFLSNEIIERFSEILYGLCLRNYLLDIST
jgi:hypothetical protein